MPGVWLWSLYLLCGLRIVGTLTSVTGVDLGVDGKSIFRSLRASDCTVDCDTRKRRPVCGTDGVTYDSRCDLKRAKKCDGKKIKVRKKGQCSAEAAASVPVADGTSKCSQEQQEAEMARQSRPDVFVPSCTSDGSYAEVQCHRHTDFCWCAAKDGRHVPGTSVKGKRPKCRERRRKKVKRTKKKRACATADRRAFNKNLVSVFKEEYGRIARGVGTTPASPSGGREAVLERTVVDWKFTELDKDLDNVLKFKEIRSFRRMVKKLIKPKTCAKRFLKNCDGNNNKAIEKSEWALCLRTDLRDSPLITPAWNQPPVISPVSNSYSEPRRTTEKKSGISPLDKRDCDEERRAALLQDSNEPNANIYIPRCSSSGKWNKAQCHAATQYCFCVDEDTGTPIPGTSTYKVEPNCTLQEDREMKGCPLEQKRRFLIDLMNDIAEEMNQQNNNTSTPGPLSSQLGVDQREEVARWKLQSLDTNRNGVLDRKEWKAIRKSDLKNKKYPKKCRRNFVRYCDENNDRRVTWDEWKDCLGLNQSYYNTLPLNPKRKGKKNPFIEQLT